MRDPLLRSSGAIEGLFSEAVVVCEGDSDRAFYEEVNERMATAGDLRAIPNCLFINAQNKQTVPSIVEPLREMGIPAAGIVDLDVLKEGGQVWTKQIGAAGIPSAQHAGLSDLRRNILQFLDGASENWKRDGGIRNLNADELEAASNLISLLAEYGLFVVPGGELEDWLGELEVAGHGSGWLIGMFEQMGENPASQDYVAPGARDVWDFIGQIRDWMIRTNRKGIPD